MTITTEQVKELRDKTGISVMQCKKALEETGGDIAKALVVLKKKGAEIALGKGARDLRAGVVSSYVHNTKTVGATVELLCETDFVEKNEEFIKLAYDIAMQVSATNPEYVKFEDIPEDAKKVAMEVFEGEVKGKPKDMREKILEGKLRSYFSDKVLLDQPFIKDPEHSILNLLENATQKFGERVEIRRFVRFSIS